jgi:hypothetical protein
MSRRVAESGSRTDAPVEGSACRALEEDTVIRLELEPEEAETLKTVLEEYVSELRMEVANTDDMGFRESLKRTEALLRSLIQRLAVH